MRTGPFSDPVIVALINRYFVPVHLNNVDGSGVRYDMPPGHEDAYLIMETPELPGREVETIIMGRKENLRGPEAAVETGVLDPMHVRAELRGFLAKHAELHHPWPELQALEGKTDVTSRLRRADLLLDEGRLDEATAILADAGLRNERAQLLRARAARMQREWDQAASALEGLSSSPARDLELIRVAWGLERMDDAESLLDAFLDRYAQSSEGAEAYYLRGLLHHRHGDDEAALATWRTGVAEHDPTGSLFAQKMHLTRIRQNFELSGVVATDIH